ncbi:uncharacterized protein ycf36 isoform X2 [Hevea brasiliensis]|uniref:uncharacterized protein ycf36 isoform X2 n=1 Tax=Hevea brasiliensis TaxID=3981 RepID=UPI0025D00A15|nr:uncharacterized protein ycf36 isoform X2 [Hevea brasiliensis]
MEQSKAIKARMAILDLHLTAKQPPVLFSPPTPTPTPIPTSKFLIPFAKPRLHHHKNIIPNIPFSSFRNGSNTPSETECPVPLDQQPINEYQNLSTSFPFSWAADDFIEYSSRLFVVGAAFVFFVGLPVAWFGSVRPELEPLKPILAALSSGILVVSLAVVRMYLGWAYVGNRLLSATVEYEETGWYDGQIWVKTSEVLARDRLLGSFSPKRVHTHLKQLRIEPFLGCIMMIQPDHSSQMHSAVSQIFLSCKKKN